MAGLRDITFKVSYDSVEDEPLKDFLVPALGASETYDRAVGYCSSALLAVIPRAFSSFAVGGGKMRLVCSPALSPADVVAMTTLTSDQADTMLENQLRAISESEAYSDPIKLMAWMIRNGSLEIKIAVPKEGTAGIFHQKIGIFEDESKNSVAFLGSNNETAAAWVNERNSESFIVQTKWSGEKGSELVTVIREKFDKFWKNRYPGFDFLELPKAIGYLVSRAPGDTDLDAIAKRIQEQAAQERQKYESAVLDNPAPNTKQLRDYQQAAVDFWEKSEQGILCFATGAGKTITALEVISRWLERDDTHSAIVLVPSVKLQKQWAEEILKYSTLAGSSILLVGGSVSQSRWKGALRGYTNGRVGDSKTIVLAVMATASKSTFMANVNWHAGLLVVADEMHNLGAPGYSELLKRISEVARLGLSATPERYEEDETHALKSAFGDELEPVIGIREAQKFRVLVQYSYHFAEVQLTDDEEREYQRLTAQISKLAAISHQVKKDEGPALKMARIKRANIVKQAEHKVHAAAEIIRQNYKKGEHWVAFCANQTQLNQLRDQLRDLRPLTYHQEMDGDMDTTLEHFTEDGGIILSIKMLNEGVDIPSLDKAVVLASSGNAREYVQRRGRVLRVHPRKAKNVQIWDLIVVDEDGFAYSTAEVKRAQEFASLARNTHVLFDLDRLVSDSQRSLFEEEAGESWQTGQ